MIDSIRVCDEHRVISGLRFRKVRHLLRRISEQIVEIRLQHRVVNVLIYFSAFPSCCLCHVWTSCISNLAVDGRHPVNTYKTVFMGSFTFPKDRLPSLDNLHRDDVWRLWTWIEYSRVIRDKVELVWHQFRGLLLRQFKATSLYRLVN